MIANREMTMDDYLAMLRRRAKWILIPALLAPLAGWLISYAFPAKYTCLLYTSPSPRDLSTSRMPSSA